MSINIKNAIIEFLKYTEKYDLEDENIQRKKRAFIKSNEYIRDNSKKVKFK